MKPTLRSLGIEYIQQFVSDKPTFIAGALKEHEEYREETGTPLQSLIIAPQSLQSRIIDLFGDSRIYGLIAWFLEQEGLEFTNDQALKNRVRHEYEAARSLQFYEDKRLFPAYYNLVAQGNGRLLHMSDIVEALKGSGY